MKRESLIVKGIAFVDMEREAYYASMPPDSPPTADQHSRYAACVLGLSLPADVVLYLLLPMYASEFGVTLAEAGILLAANRLIRVIGYGWVARFYAKHGDRLTSTLAVVATVVCALSYTTLSGFWLLLPLRLLWGMAFAAMNISTQALATVQPNGAARRSGRSRAYIALGPVAALPLAAIAAQWHGPRIIFFLLAVAALLSLLFARRLPSAGSALPKRTRGLKRPNSLDTWSFLEGLTLDGLFIIGLSYLGKDILPDNAVIVAGLLLATRYMGEIVLSPIGGLLAERVGAVKLLVALSLLTALALFGFAFGWLWSCAACIVVLRSLQLPLLAPIVAQQTPGPDRVYALATRSMWRDIGAGLGPVLAGVLLPVLSPMWIYGVPALLLAWAAWACTQEPKRKAPNTE
jgi:DHA1 family inner membrane transport protein